MDQQMLKLLLLVAYIAVVLVFFLSRRHAKGPKIPEPPRVPSSIPVPWINSVYGLLRRRMQHFVDVGVKWRQPISTIALPGMNIYVVGSTKFMTSIQRQPEVLSARFFFGQIIPGMVGVNKQSFDSFADIKGSGSNSGDSLLLEGIRATKRILNSKSGSDMNFDAANIINCNFEHLGQEKFDQPVDLWEWIRRETVLAISESTYGKNNPFWDPEIRSAFWDFADDSIWLWLTSALPNRLVSKMLKGLNGREKLVKALHEYFTRQGHERGSPIVSTHYSIFAKYIDHNEIARFECANAMGSFANTAPATFWTVWHIFSNPALVADIRAQITAITSTRQDEDGHVVHEISQKRLREETVLFSALEETSRFRTSGMGVRMVLEDTTVSSGEETFLLKKGGVVVIANRALHTDKSTWGDDADTFVASRFQQKAPPMAFRGFGQGANACCGKKFALHAISSFVAMLVMRYDIEPVDGVWVEPGQDGRDTTSQVASPVGRPKVSMVPREDAGKVSWKFVP
ncbi:cytochrome P450 [Lentithecium fluviatile CBS 122367]|uniref:Cytochrome P450 n=1 Tax=Lentithecium fluviatile CBS 122367 TaxID=1168545 RepID=A0A6G1JHS4_9PLEO|nr:cytochrome P450 [Lentithecium fluviatile CBS 122367]